MFLTCFPPPDTAVLLRLHTSPRLCFLSPVPQQLPLEASPASMADRSPEGPHCDGIAGDDAPRTSGRRSSMPALTNTRLASTPPPSLSSPRPCLSFLKEIAARSTDHQKKIVADIGFGFILDLPDEFHVKYSVFAWLLSSFHTPSCSFVLENGARIHVSSALVRRLLAFPECEHKLVKKEADPRSEEYAVAAKRLAVVNRWDSVSLTRAHDVLEAALGRSMDAQLESAFRAALVLYVTGNFLAPRPGNSLVGGEIVEAIARKGVICACDWASYVVDHLKDAAESMQEQLRVRNELNNVDLCACPALCMMAYYLAAGDVEKLRFLARKPSPLFRYFDNNLIKQLDRPLSRARKTLPSWLRINGKGETRNLVSSIEVSIKDTTARLQNALLIDEILSNTPNSTHRALEGSCEAHHGVTGCTYLDKGKAVMDSHKPSDHNAEVLINVTTDDVNNYLFQTGTSDPTPQDCPKRLCTERNRAISVSPPIYDLSGSKRPAGSVSWDQSVPSADCPRYDTSGCSSGGVRLHSLLPLNLDLGRATLAERTCSVGPKATLAPQASPMSVTSRLAAQLPDLNLPVQDPDEGIIVLDPEPPTPHVSAQQPGNSVQFPRRPLAIDSDPAASVCRILSMGHDDANLLDRLWLYYDGPDPISLNGWEFIKEFCSEMQLSKKAMGAVLACFQALNGSYAGHGGEFVVKNRIFLPPSWLEECLDNHNRGMAHIASMFFNADVLNFSPAMCQTVVAPVYTRGLWFCFYFDLARKKAAMLHPSCPRIVAQEEANYLSAIAGMILQGLALSFATVGHEAVSPVNEWKYSFVEWDGATVATGMDGLFAVLFAIVFDGPHSIARTSLEGGGWGFRWTLCRMLLESSKNMAQWDGISGWKDH